MPGHGYLECTMPNTRALELRWCLRSHRERSGVLTVEVEIEVVDWFVGCAVKDALVLHAT